MYIYYALFLKKIIYLRCITYPKTPLSNYFTTFIYLIRLILQEYNIYILSAVLIICLQLMREFF